MESSNGGSSRSSSELSQLGYLLEKNDSYNDDQGLHNAAWLRPLSTARLVAANPRFSLRSALRLITRPITLLIPSFLHPGREDGLTQPETLPPTAFLDGMRGLAAFVVFICHLTYGTFDIGHAYGANPEDESPSQNEYYAFLRLPVVRLLYSGPPMVAIFFVISGYALSYKPVKLMRTQQYESLMSTMTSSIFRRGLRLFLPCFASTLIVITLAQLNLYKLTEQFSEQMRGIKEDHCYTQEHPWLQFTDWVQQILIFVDPFDWHIYAGSVELDRHLWTIPAEYRCSMALFLTQMMVARMSPRLRISTLTGLMTWGISWNRWDLCPFWAGMIIAELDIIHVAPPSTLSSIGGLITNPSKLEKNDPSKPSPVLKSRRGSFTAFYWILFLLSLILLSYPDAAGHATPGYITLTWLIPESFTEKHRFWPTVGAILIIWSTCHLSSLRDKVFCWKPIQYLGKISFPLYVMHGPVIHTLGYLILPLTPKIETPGAMQTFEIAFFKSSLVVIVAVIWAADVFLRLVDLPCVNFARVLEKRFFAE